MIYKATQFRIWNTYGITHIRMWVEPRLGSMQYIIHMYLTRVDSTIKYSNPVQVYFVLFVLYVRSFVQQIGLILVFGEIKAFLIIVLVHYTTKAMMWSLVGGS